jgi:hypothetical protein
VLEPTFNLSRIGAQATINVIGRRIESIVSCHVTGSTYILAEGNLMVVRDVLNQVIPVENDVHITTMTAYMLGLIDKDQRASLDKELEHESKERQRANALAEIQAIAEANDIDLGAL